MRKEEYTVYVKDFSGERHFMYYDSERKGYRWQPLPTDSYSNLEGVVYFKNMSTLYVALIKLLNQTETEYSNSYRGNEIGIQKVVTEETVIDLGLS